MLIKNKTCRWNNFSFLFYQKISHVCLDNDQFLLFLVKTLKQKLILAENYRHILSKNGKKIFCRMYKHKRKFFRSFSSFELLVKKGGGCRLFQKHFSAENQNGIFGC